MFAAIRLRLNRVHLPRSFRLLKIGRRHYGPRSVVTGKTARVLAIFVILAAVPYIVPGLRDYRIFMPSISLKAGRKIGSAELQGDGGAAATQLAAVRTGGLAGADKGSRNQPQAKPGEIEDPSGRALDHFFQSLIRAEDEAGKAIVCHYGDSPITDDGITSTIRERLQTRFGDGGHGFILIAKPWGWYQHQGVVQEPGRGWTTDPMFISRGDHLFGLGGATFTAGRAGVTATFGTASDGKVGRTVSDFDIYYLAQPAGGSFDVDVDGSTFGRVSTAGSTVHSGFYRVDVPDGPHALKITTAGDGEVRLFGVVLESGPTGVEYDSLGVNGAYVGLLAHYMDERHWVEQLRHRNPDLVILNYGTNESQFEKLSMDQYQKDTKEVVRRIREALPSVSIMLVGPMDRGMRADGGDIVTRPMIPKLISYQRKIAAETGCAFFDTFTAMGGQGTAADWYESRPRLMGGDLTHPTAKGAEIVGNLIAEAVMHAYQSYVGTVVAAATRVAPKSAESPGGTKKTVSVVPNLK